MPIVHVAIYKLGGQGTSARGVVRGRCPQLPLARRGCEGARHQRGGAREARGDHRAARRARRRPEHRWSRSPRGGLAGRAQGTRVRTSLPRHVGGRSRHDDLHVGHHGPAQGRAACPSGPARAFARRADAARVPAAAGRSAWTPADWPGAGEFSTSCCRALLGVPVVARKFDKFDPEEAFRLMADHGVRNTFVPPTALRMLRAVTNPAGPIRSEAAHGRLRRRGPRGRDLRGDARRWGSPSTSFTWTTSAISSCLRAAIGVAKPGAIGRAVPGHQVAVIREDGTVSEPGELGQIAVLRPTP